MELNNFINNNIDNYIELIKKEEYMLSISKII